MNDPANIVISFDEMLEWLHSYKVETGMSWTALGRESGIPYGTLSSITSANFAGNRERTAERIYAFKQKVASQQARAKVALARPTFIETETAMSLLFLMEWAQGGRMTLAATGPGTGKDMAAEHYKASMGATVWLATMKQTTKSVTAMIAQVMKSMGLNNTSGWAQQRSQQIENHVVGKKGLLIVNEANHLDWSSLEELRGLHDATGVGICMLGNEELVERVRGGARSHAYARLNSRIAHCFIQNLPTVRDVEIYLDALAKTEPALDDPALRRPLIEVALAPGHGGLRELYQTLELAHMLAISAEQPLELEHVRKAIGTRTTRVNVRAA